MAFALGLLCAVPTNASNAIVHTTLETCANLGQDRNEVSSQLANLGWQSDEAPTNVLDLLFWTQFARDYAIRDDESLKLSGGSGELGEGLGYLIVNSSFMSASILGNSALPKNQPSYSQGPYRLAVLGVSLGEGYCVLAGPPSIAQDIIDLTEFTGRWPDDLPKSNRPGVDALFGEVEDLRIFIAKLDQLELINLYSSMQITLPYSRTEFDIGVFDSVPSTLAYIPSKQPQ